MAVSMAGLLTAIGLLILFHTTYGVIKHREMLKLVQEEYDSLPFTLLVELILGTSLAGLGGFIMAGPLKPVMMTKQSGLSDQNTMRLDFVSFNTRARAFGFTIPQR